MEELAQLGVKAALEANWEEAIKINKKILKEQPLDINSLNRLAFAYQATNDFEKAKVTYAKVLKLDKYNSIALKNLERLKLWKGKKRLANNNTMSGKVFNFLEEPGRTKLVTLINLAPPATISQLRPSQSVFLTVKRKSIMISDENDNYLGALPDDLAFKMMRFISANYKYSCVVKSAEKNSVVVLIRELERGKKFKNQPTFPSGNSDLEYVIIPPLDISDETAPPDKPSSGLEDENEPDNDNPSEKEED